MVRTNEIARSLIITLALLLQQLSLFGPFLSLVQNIARLQRHKSMKFDLVHQTVSFHERVGSGDKTISVL